MLKNLLITLAFIALLSNVHTYSDALTLFWRRVSKANIINLSDTCTPISCEASSNKCSSKNGNTWNLGENVC